MQEGKNSEAAAADHICLPTVLMLAPSAGEAPACLIVVLVCLPHVLNAEKTVRPEKTVSRHGIKLPLLAGSPPYPHHKLLLQEPQ